MRSHTEDDGCYLELINDLAERCDHEYYMSAGGPKLGNKARAERGYKRIKEYISEIKSLRLSVSCELCKEEIDRQIILQERGLNEIKHVWHFF